MLAVLTAASRPENENADIKINTDKYKIAQRFMKYKITIKLEAKFWRMVEERWARDGARRDPNMKGGSSRQWHKDR